MPRGRTRDNFWHNKMRRINRKYLESRAVNTCEQENGKDGPGEAEERGGRGEQRSPLLHFFPSGRYECSYVVSRIPSSTCRQNRTTRENSVSNFAFRRYLLQNTAPSVISKREHPRSTRSGPGSKGAQQKTAKVAPGCSGGKGGGTFGGVAGHRGEAEEAVNVKGQ